VTSRIDLLWRRHRALVLIGSALIGITAAAAIVWPITDLIAAHDVGVMAGAQRARQLQMAREAVRTQLLTLGAGVFAAGALVFTARNSIFAQRAVQLTEQGQVTERYARAIEQLGSEKLDVRIGGIYALERIARDSARDHPTVMEVLAAFVREHSREPWPLPAHGTALTGRSTRPDVQAAMTVIGRRTTEYDGGQIDLRGANLSGADLGGAQLDGANLRWTNLTRAFANQAKLAGAQFRSAELPEVDFSGAKLCGAGFTDAKLPDAFMPGADLTGAHFQRADLTRANLTIAVLAGAYLRGVNLTSANLVQTDLAGADLVDAMMREANLTDASLGGADLTRADLSTARLANTNFTEANLTDAWFPTAGPIPNGWVVGDLGRLTRSKVDPR
jgi:uncharacterized protein YjbI with pentapeptide repeats